MTKFATTLPACALVAALCCSFAAAAHAQASSLTTVDGAVVLHAPNPPAPALPDLRVNPPEDAPKAVTKVAGTTVKLKHPRRHVKHVAAKKKPHHHKVIKHAVTQTECLPPR